MNIAKKFLATVALALVAQAAQAASVTLTLYPDGPGQFKITAKVGGADSAGLSGYGGDLTGPIATLTHVSPGSGFANGPGGASGPAGFTFARSANNTNFVAGFQDQSAIPIYGFGQEAGSYAAKGITPLAPSPRNEWDAELLIATGTYTGSFDALDWNRQGPNVGANVFNAAGSIVVRGPESLEYIVAPEPASFVMAGLGLIGMLAVRRKLA